MDTQDLFHIDSTILIGIVSSMFLIFNYEQNSRKIAFVNLSN